MSGAEIQIETIFVLEIWQGKRNVVPFQRVRWNTIYFFAQIPVRISTSARSLTSKTYIHLEYALRVYFSIVCRGCAEPERDMAGVHSFRTRRLDTKALQNIDIHLQNFTSPSKIIQEKLTLFMVNNYIAKH